jgi:DNA polymerase alpha subunit B
MHKIIFFQKTFGFSNYDIFVIIIGYFMTLEIFKDYLGSKICLTGVCLNETWNTIHNTKMSSNLCSIRNFAKIFDLKRKIFLKIDCFQIFGKLKLVVNGFSFKQYNKNHYNRGLEEIDLHESEKFDLIFPEDFKRSFRIGEDCISNSSKFICEQQKSLLRTFLIDYEFNDSLKIDDLLSSKTRKKTIIVGRILGTIPFISSNETCYNKKILAIKTIKEISKTDYVLINLKILDTFSFFHGELVVMEVFNFSGSFFLFYHMLYNLPLTRKRMQFGEDYHVGRLSSQRILIVSGPYSSEKDLKYDMFEEFLCGPVKSINPHLVILLGPFVDENHPKIKKANLNLTYNEIFLEKFLHRLKDFIEENNYRETEFLLISSSSDIQSVPLYPNNIHNIIISQAINKKKSIKMAPNPCIYDARGLIVAATSVDIVDSISKSEFTFGLSCRHIAERIAYQFLRTRSFCPVFPSKNRIVLDNSKRELLDFSIDPKLLIIPSNQLPFVKLLKDENNKLSVNKKSIILNPGMLTVGIARGTFAYVEVVSFKKKDKGSINIEIN